MIEKIQLILKTLPNKPGVYQFLNQSGVVIYIGKAKNLKKRVSQYFQKEHDQAKTRILVRKINDIKTIVVETESDALLLENSLIKKYQPRYNILLKDDKTYPWICVKNERFPRVFATRKFIKDGSEYFGPYASPRVSRTLLELIKDLYPLRTCNYDLSPEKIQNGKYKVCLEYHLGNCMGPCEGLQSAEKYDQIITSVKNIIKGNFSGAMQYLQTKMQQYADDLKFEEAQKIKEKIGHLENYHAKSTVVHPSITNVDVYSIVSDDDAAYVNYFGIVNGAIIRSHTQEIKKKLDESDAEILEKTTYHLREKFPSDAKEIYVPFPIELGLENLKITVPQIGDKKRIVELSERNAKYYRLEKLKQTKIVDPERHTRRVMAQMKKDLRLPEEPQHIEGFDNSNLQGTNPVSACVVFKDGKPSKKEYRHFKVKTVVGPDDFATMEEVIYRRYKRLLEEEKPLPQLIVIDGGKGQLGAALKSLDQLDLRGKISVIGIAKRLEEIYYPGDLLPMYLDKTSETLKILQHIRNESHRFGITFHRNLRSKNTFKSELELIPGVGEKTIQDLLRKFKSVKKIKTLSQEELATVVGNARAKKIRDYFDGEKT